MAEGSSRTTEGMLSLSWNNHSAAFTQTLATLREKEIYTDVTLACGGKFYPVHKLVLSTCSDYFLQMFERTSCKHPIIILKDVQCREMEALLSYMYAGIVCVPQSDLTQLIMVAEALQIKGLAVPDETMCSNKRLSHTWSPTDDRISPHAKRLRQGDNGAGVQYQRLSDGQTMVKTQTLTGIPSFSGAVPQTHSSSPTVSNSNLGKHLQHSIRPTYTTVRYSPYPREVEQRQASPKQIQTISMKEFLGMFKHGDSKSAVPQSNGSEGSTSQHESQNSVTEIDREILPETLVKVEVEEGTEPVRVEDFVDPSLAYDADSCQGQTQPRMDQTNPSKIDVSFGESERIGDFAVKEEVELSQEYEKTSENAVCSATPGGGNGQLSQQPQAVKIEKLDIQPFPSSHQEASENTPPKSSAGDTVVSWGEDEDSSHPLDLSDAQKPHTHQIGSDQDSPRVIKRLYDNRLMKFPCPYCSFKTTQKVQLTKHIQDHTKENPFTCPYCPFRAPLHVSLKEHINTHKSGSEGGH